MSSHSVHNEWEKNQKKYIKRETILLCSYDDRLDNMRSLAPQLA